MADDASPNNRPISGILALGYMATGIGFFLLGLQELKAYRARMAAAAGTAGLGRVVKGRVVGRGGALGETLADAAERGSGAVRKATTFNVHTIDQRVKHIQDLVRQGATDPKIIEAARAIVTQKTSDGQWAIAPKDYIGEARALFKAVTDPHSPYAVRYLRDPQKTDVFTKASTTMRLRGEDCDGLSIYLGAMLAAIGAAPQLVVIQAGNAPDWSHIFLRIPRGGSDGVHSSGGDNDPTDYFVLDPSMADKAPGWEPPGLTQVLRTGSPSGIVKKAKIYNV